MTGPGTWADDWGEWADAQYEAWKDERGRESADCEVQRGAGQGQGEAEG